jgi:hypothetical protein
MKGSRTIPILGFLAGAFFVQTAALWSQNPAAPAAPLPLSPVILTENPEVVQRFAVNPEAVHEMVDRAVLKLTSAQEIGAAWKRLGITPQDVVGIKITTTGGPLLSTHRPIVQAICNGLQAAGVSPSHIIIWDKFEGDLRRAGYVPTAGDETHVGIAAIFPGTGYDPNVVYKNEQIGSLIWGDYDFIRNDSHADLFADAREAVNNDKTYGSRDPNNDLLNGGSTIPQTSNHSYYARLVTRTCTKIINVPVLTDNPYIGINGCLGSLALGCVDNNRRFQGEPTYGDPAVCEILDKDFIRHKVIIHILDALVAEYAGGPQFDPQFTQSIGALYVSRDPVAIDSLVLPRLEEWRRQGHVDPIGKTASHVKTAVFYNMGTDNPQRIQLLKLP